MNNPININDAKTQFSKLIEAASKGEEIIIARAGVPVARLLPCAPEVGIRKPGALKGRIRIADDFDAPLAGDVLASFVGR